MCIKVIICAAGCAAHLAGVVAAHTLVPVIGIPVEGGPFKGMDALLATVQMPGGIPVATVACGGGGPKNAGLFAMRILALSDETVAAKMVDFREAMAVKVKAADAELQAELGH
jgi:5-(carboxyamino)imidazole ribonucleotide mutase